MREPVVRVLGLSATAGYVALIAWLFAHQPQSMAEVTGGLSASVGAYRIDQQAFDDGLRLFRQDQFEAAVSAFERADPARQDARTQFLLGMALLPGRHASRWIARRPADEIRSMN